MMSPSHRQHVPAKGAGSTRRRPGLIVLAGAMMLLAGWAGCTKTEEEVPPAQVKTVDASAYGLTLDEAATPQQVVYVLLRALAADVRAAQAHEHDRRKEATDLTYRLAAYSTIERRLLETVNVDRKDENKQTTLGQHRDQRLYEFTRYWAPIVSHYIDSFDTDFEAFRAKAWVLAAPGGQKAHLYYGLCHDPSETDPAKRQTATLDVELVKETAGGQSYWRVARIDYLGRTPPEPEIVEAFGMTLDESASPRQVASMLLRALRRQVELASTGTRGEQRAAAMLTFTLAAHASIEKRLLAALNKDTPKAEAGQTLGPDRPGRLFAVTAQWAPLTAEFIRMLGPDVDQAVASMKEVSSPDGTVHLLSLLSVTPSATPLATPPSVALDIELARVAAGKGTLWRVSNVGYLRATPTSAATQPPPTTATAPAPGE